MSAVVSRTLQNTKVPCLPPRRAPRGAEALLLPGESLEPLHPEALGGGAPAHLLLNRAFAGDARCAAVLAHLVARLEKSVKQWPPVMQLPLQVRGVQVSPARQAAILQRLQDNPPQDPWQEALPPTPPQQLRDRHPRL
ncbi:unnamed protein product [Polarella glacialis]|uniref:Uncharacterized protein n=1 Tax=Polarella glacialis TaxID=89957 RepID=A0A813JSC7_POLGL|nr:unnamed protein product [Polarella glacialis]